MKCVSSIASQTFSIVPVECVTEIADLSASTVGFVESFGALPAVTILVISATTRISGRSTSTDNAIAIGRYVARVASQALTSFVAVCPALRVNWQTLSTRLNVAVRTFIANSIGEVTAVTHTSILLNSAITVLEYVASIA